ncbi:hypothetical protein [Streptomyces brasiliscabiei]|uniref:hypothetical protein n=1 Tax=Streptomyces brasiliscabiei TaxID=2736302 RepID=UPI001C0F8174|nr:hypothetical protein [Streptomyces brasiliscabiei]
MSAPHPPAEEGSPRDDKACRWKLPAPDTRLGVLFYGVLAGLMVWLLIDVIPQHLHITWR